jgi:hypothetical protein
MPADEERLSRAWRPRPGGMPKPSLRDTTRPGYVAATAEEATADELDRWAYWRSASLEERGRALAELLDFVDATGRFPPKRDMFPGWKRLARQQNNRHSRANVR